MSLYACPDCNAERLNNDLPTCPKCGSDKPPYLDDSCPDCRDEKLDLEAERGKLEGLIRELLDGFYPFHSCFEANGPRSTDGVELGRRMREAIDWIDPEKVEAER